jgi:hypothetical protein
MKLSRLFMIALLTGTLGMIGCSDDPPQTGNGGTGGGAAGTGGTGGDGAAGTGGTGGSSGEVCTLGVCAEPGAFKTACLMAYDTCVEKGDRTPAECNTIAETANCEESNP